ncbi:MAG: 1-acyl-sn-glycerol-3-phosphate acyltransferase [Clostridia bacterium]|nr:1-acyl-sn-glycerol-3-phosphate acyltransferase [Clostridia bacterium]
MKKPPKKKLTKEEKNHRFYMRAHRVLAGIFRFLLRLRPQGRENVPAEGGFLICANHVAFCDVVSIAAVLPRQVRYLAKAELFRVPLLGRLITTLGACKLDRGGGDVAAIKKTIALAAGGELVAIFPQGHRYGGKNPADTPIKNGAGMIALRAGCPVIPVCLKMKKQRYALFRRVEVIFGQPIPHEELVSEGLSGSEAYRAASEKIFEEICALGGFVPTAPVEGGKS